MDRAEHMEQQEKRCYNCGHRLLPEDKYCPACGQKHTDGKITLRELFSEFFAVVFNLDNKIFRSLAALMIPGKLTEEYFLGRIRRYFHPLRMFLVLGLLFLLALGSLLRSAETELSENIEQSNVQSYGYYLALQEADSLAKTYREQFPGPNVDQAFDSLLLGMEESPYHRDDSITLGIFSDNFLTIETSLEIARKDIFELPIDTLYARYGIDDFWQQLLIRQEIRFLTQGSKFISFIIGNAIWAILLMMPFLGLLLMLFYIRRGHYFVEHLVFAFHTHSFVFLATAIWIFLSRYSGEEIWIAYVLLIPAYFILSLRRIYEQSWFKTLLKAFFLSIFYNIIISIFLLISLLLGFLVF